MSGQTGELVPLYATAHGKALLADLDLQELETLLGSGPLHAYTKRSATAIGDLARTCSRIERHGFASDDGEFVEGLRCVAAPIRDQDGVVIASIGISAPLSRFPKSLYTVRGKQVADIARAISASIGV